MNPLESDCDMRMLAIDEDAVREPILTKNS